MSFEPHVRHRAYFKKKNKNKHKNKNTNNAKGAEEIT